LSKEQQDANWFSAPSALRVYGRAFKATATTLIFTFYIIMIIISSIQKNKKGENLESTRSRNQTLQNVHDACKHGGNWDWLAKM